MRYTATASLLLIFTFTFIQAMEAPKSKFSRLQELPLTALAHDILQCSDSDIAEWLNFIEENFSVQKKEALCREIFYQNKHIFEEIFHYALTPREPEGPVHNIHAVALSSHAQYLATAVTNSVICWRVEDLLELNLCHGHTAPINALTFSNNTYRLITGSADKTIRVFLILNGLCESIMKGHTGAITCLLFNSSTNTIISGSEDRTVRIWDLYSGEELQKFTRGSSTVTSLALSPDCTQVAISFENGKLYLWDITSYKSRELINHPYGITALAWSKRTNKIFAGSKSNNVLMINPQSSDDIKLFQSTEGEITSLDISYDDNYLITGSSQGYIRLWDTHTQRCIRLLHHNSSPVQGVAFSPLSNFTVSAVYQNKIYLWDLTDFAAAYGLRSTLLIIMLSRWKQNSQRKFIHIAQKGNWYGIYKQLPNNIRTTLDQHFEIHGPSCGCTIL